MTKLIDVDWCSEQAAENYAKNFSEPHIELYERNESDDSDVDVATRKVNIHQNYNDQRCNKLA